MARRPPPRKGGADASNARSLPARATPLRSAGSRRLKTRWQASVFQVIFRAISAGREDDPGATAGGVVGRARDPLRPRRPGASGAARGPQARAGRSRGARDARRDSTPARPLPHPPRARRPRRRGHEVPHPRERVARSPPPEFRDPGGPDRLPGARRLPARRGGVRAGGPPVAPGRIPALVPRVDGGRLLRVEALVHPHVPRGRHSPARRADRGGDAPPLLAHDRTRSRPALERSRTRARLRRLRHHGPPLPGRLHRRARAEAAPAVARERGQAAGQVAQGIPGRHRAPARTSRPRDARRKHVAPSGHGYGTLPGVWGPSTKSAALVFVFCKTGPTGPDLSKRR